MPDARPPWVLIAALAAIGAAVGGTMAWWRMHPPPPTSPVAPSPDWHLAGDDPELGRRVYAYCQGCHMVDGRGVPGVYPALVGSGWVAGDARPLIRMLLHGYDSTGRSLAEAANASMPGYAGRLADHEIAAVLTWIRAQWGHRSPPIPAAAVAAERAASATRAAPWTPAEIVR